jgi:hypothetical protein
MTDEEVLQFIEEAEAKIESWATRDGVDMATWSPTIPVNVTAAATHKASEITIARKQYDARLASSESRSGTSMTLNPKDRIEFYRSQAEEAWTAYLISVTIAAPKSTTFGLTPEAGVFDEETWRYGREEDDL